MPATTRRNRRRRIAALQGEWIDQSQWGEEGWAFASDQLPEMSFVGVFERGGSFEWECGEAGAYGEVHQKGTSATLEEAQAAAVKAAETMPNYDEYYS